MIALRVAGVVVNIILPGIGTLLVGKIPQGLIQFALFLVSMLFIGSLIGALLGVSIYVTTMIWSVGSAIKPKKPRH